jgi:hypothetical protein
MSKPSDGAVEAAEKIITGLHLGSYNRRVIADFIDRLAVQPAVAAAEAELEAYRQAERDSGIEGEERQQRVSEAVLNLQTLRRRAESAEAEVAKLREAAIAARDWIFTDLTASPQGRLLRDDESQRELLGKIAVALDKGKIF